MRVLERREEKRERRWRTLAERVRALEQTGEPRRALDQGSSTRRGLEDCQKCSKCEEICMKQHGTCHPLLTEILTVPVKSTRELGGKDETSRLSRVVDDGDVVSENVDAGCAPTPSGRNVLGYLVVVVVWLSERD